MSIIKDSRYTACVYHKGFSTDSPCILTRVIIHSFSVLIAGFIHFMLCPQSYPQIFSHTVHIIGITSIRNMSTKQDSPGDFKPQQLSIISPGGNHIVRQSLCLAVSTLQGTLYYWTWIPLSCWSYHWLNS